jgi:hypothetical protein
LIIFAATSMDRLDRLSRRFLELLDSMRV